MYSAVKKLRQVQRNKNKKQLKNTNTKKQIILPLFFATATVAVICLTYPNLASAKPANFDIDWGIKISYEQGLVLSATETNTDISDLTISNLIRAVNEDRIKANLHPLRHDSLLDQAAMLKAQNMIENEYFAHTSPEGVNPWNWFREADYDYYYAGENLALDFSSSTDVEEAWMKSPKHRENILNPLYDDVGYAIAKGTFSSINGENIAKARTGVIIVQLFGKRNPLQSTNSLVDKDNEPISSPTVLSSLEETLKNNLGINSIAKSVGIFGAKLFNSTESNINSSDTPKNYVAGANEESNQSTPWQFIGLGLAAIMITASTKYALI